jgi:superfamily II DNA/RNA helicase
MRHRHVRIVTTYTDRPYSVFQKEVGPYLLTYPAEAKFIVYSNRRTKIKTVEQKLASFLDSTDGFSKIDVVCLVGTLTKEQKAHYIDIFVNGSPGYCPRFLLATSGAANAGIDCDDVFGVYRLDFPPSLLDWCQEKGRAGRLLSATPDQYFYHLCYSCESYLHLFERISNPAESNVDPTYRTSQLQDLQEVLQILLLPKHCFQFELETRLLNPTYRPNGDENLPCGMCTYCTGYTP